MTTTTDDGFSDAEREAMRERMSELKKAGGSDGEQDVLAAIDKMPEPEQAVAFAFHGLVREAAPHLVPRTWYGMPAYARPGKKGKIICFFKGASKFGARYHEVGFSDSAALDEGSMWATAFALPGWTAADETTLRALLGRAAA